LDGQPLWNTALGQAEVRGMDDARISGQTFLAAATNNGVVRVIDDTGGTVWENSQETLRRMRAFDLDGDGNSEIITGGEFGAFFIYSAADGRILYNDALGQAISEVREV